MKILTPISLILMRNSLTRRRGNYQEDYPNHHVLKRAGHIVHLTDTSSNTDPIAV